MQHMSSNHCRQSCSTVWLRKPPNSTQKLLHSKLQLKAKGPQKGKPLRNTCQWTKTSCKWVRVFTEWLLSKILQLLMDKLCPKTSACARLFSTLFEGMLDIRKTVFLERKSLKLPISLNELFIPCRTTGLQEQW